MLLICQKKIKRIRKITARKITKIKIETLTMKTATITIADSFKRGYKKVPFILNIFIQTIALCKIV